MKDGLVCESVNDMKQTPTRSGDQPRVLSDMINLFKSPKVTEIILDM